MKAKSTVRDMKIFKKMEKYVAIILTDVPKGDWNSKLTMDKVKIVCQSYGLEEFTKKFCILKKL